MLTRTIHLLPKKSELVFTSLEDEGGKKNSSMIFYEVDVVPKINDRNPTPLELMPYKLCISLEKEGSDWRVCNFCDRQFDFSVSELQFKQLLEFFNKDKFPYSISLIVKDEFDINYSDEDILEHMFITRFTINFNGKFEN